MVSRGGMAESVHAVAACVSDRDGRLAGESSPGAAALEVFVRSAAKPFQALAAVRADALEALGLGDRHLAVACASHDSSEERVLLVQEILATAGLGEDALACGIAAPLDGRVAREIGDDIRPVHHNCSGKHALGLALCVHEGWPTDAYLEPAHPLQEALRATVAEATGSRPSEAIDGCGMPAYRMPLGALALAFGRLGGGGLGGGGERVAAAMVANSPLVGREGGIDTNLMHASRGLVAKLGAEGVVAAGLPDGRGMAVKVLDGAGRALGPAAVRTLRVGLAVEAGPSLDLLASPAVRTARGAEAGSVEAELEFLPVR
ncbi:MAG: asparaginase [Thermoleophilaceae bacterium]|nr:asparaginase [Thermoleophilaceae bacterium]